MQTALARTCEGCRSVLSTYPSCESLRIRSLANQTIDVLQALRGGHRTSILVADLPGEVSLRLGRRSWSHCGSSSWSLSRSSGRCSSWRVSRCSCTTGAHAAVSTAVSGTARSSTVWCASSAAVASCTVVGIGAASTGTSSAAVSGVAALAGIITAFASVAALARINAGGIADRLLAGWIDNVISALLQSLFSLTTDTTVTVSQSDGQGFHDTLRTAALVLAKFVADLVSCSPANAVIRIVQTIDEGRHDFGIADAIVLPSQLGQSTTTLMSLATRLGLINQFSDFASVFAASGRAAVISCTGTSSAAGTGT